MLLPVGIAGNVASLVKDMRAPPAFCVVLFLFNIKIVIVVGVVLEWMEEDSATLAPLILLQQACKTLVIVARLGSASP